MKTPSPRVSPKSLSCFFPVQFPKSPHILWSVSDEIKKISYGYGNTSTYFWFVLSFYFPFLFKPTVRKQEIIKVTEQLIEAISNGDFESYT